jgi:PhnB protein
MARYVKTSDFSNILILSPSTFGPLFNIPNSKTMEIPKGHQAVMPYLMVKGALKFIDFAKTVFDARLTTDMHKLREDKETVMHSEITIGGSTIMFSDAGEQWPEQTANLFVYVDNADLTYQKAIESGATTVMELSNQDYGRSCGVTDPLGNVWWITSVNQR